MRVVKTKYRLILKKDDNEEILWRGTKKECEKKKLDFSFTHNSGKLVVEEDEVETKEIKTTFKGVLGFLVIASLTYLCWINGKKVYITD